MSRGARSRPLRAATGLVAAAIVGTSVVSLAACTAVLDGYYLLEASAKAFLWDEFDWFDHGRWKHSAFDGHTVRMDARGGYLVVWGTLNAIRSTDTVPGHAEVILHLGAWPSGTDPVLDNRQAFDFGVVFVEPRSDQVRGPVVELKLAEVAAPDALDRLRIRSDLSGEVLSEDWRATGDAGMTELRIVFDRWAEPPEVRAELLDSSGARLLSASATVEGGWSRRAHLALIVSAMVDVDPTPPKVQPRVIDSLFVLPPERR